MKQKRQIKYLSYKILLATAVLLLLTYALLLRKPLFSSSYSTVLEDSKGELLGAQVAADGQWRFPPAHEVPDKVATALVAYEDKRFYRHFGFDLRAIARAARRNIRTGRVVEGGSTITMQVIRLSRKNRRRVISEKIIELILATRLELKYSKNEILALYASHAPFGGNVV
ncbi:MAG: transglycosylase domain-containing protein, partial [Prevotellaceae bacterium]|nr:transglycosylase domain-containing protein [Prevotellaceae bacterium]